MLRWYFPKYLPLFYWRTLCLKLSQSSIIYSFKVYTIDVDVQAGITDLKAEVMVISTYFTLLPSLLPQSVSEYIVLSRSRLTLLFAAISETLDNLPTISITDEEWVVLNLQEVDELKHLFLKSENKHHHHQIIFYQFLSCVSKRYGKQLR